jgi:transposase-like protein
MTEDKQSSTATQAQQAPAAPSLDEAFADVQTSVERFCLLAGIEVLQDMMEQDARRACGGQRYARSSERQAYRWGTTTSVLGYQGGKVSVQRPRVRTAAGEEVTLPSWAELRDPDVLRQ